MTAATVDIVMTYPPTSAAAVAAAQAVQVACDPYWIRGHGKAVRTPGSVVLAITADGWPTVAAAIEQARRAAGPEFSVSVLDHPTF